MSSEIYSISNDIASGSLDISTLRSEISADPAVPNSTYMIAKGDVLEIFFAIGLSPSEKIALDNIVLIHPQISPDNPDNDGSWNNDTNPTANDDSTIGVSVGDIWVNTVTLEGFMCVDNSVGQSVWRSTTASGPILDYLFDTLGQLIYITRPPSRSQVLTV